MKQYTHWSKIPCIKIQVTEEEQILEYLKRHEEGLYEHFKGSIPRECIL